MAIFIPCRELPADLSVWWTQVAYGGVSTCIQGNSDAGRPFDGCTLPNCVGWSWGRWQQLQESIDYRLPTADAYQWFTLAEAAGLETGQEPKLGAVACFSGGHVCNVEYISPYGSYIECSESDWSGPLFSYRTRYRSNNWEYGIATGFQGFIYSNVNYDPFRIWMLKKRRKNVCRRLVMTS